MFLLIVVTLGVLFFITRWAYRKGKAGWDKYNGLEGWFAKIVQNEIYAVTGGKNGNIRFFFGEMSYADVDPKTGKIVPKGTVVLNPIDAWIRKEFNRVFIGLPYEPWARQVKRLGIDRVTLKSTEKILGASNQYLSDRLLAETKDEAGLYGRFPRIQLSTDIDIGSDFRIEVMTTAFCEVFDAMPVFEVYNKDFLQVTSRIINSHLDALIRNISWEKFKESIGSTLDAASLATINTLLEPVGIHVTQITIDDWGISKSSADIQAKLAEKRKALIDADVIKTKTDAQNEATRSTADAKLYQSQQEGEGERLRLEAIARGRAATVKELIAQYMGEGMSRIEAARLANAEILNESKYPNLTGLKTLVEDKTGIIISTGGNDD